MNIWLNLICLQGICVIFLLGYGVHINIKANQILKWKHQGPEGTNNSLEE